MSNSSFWMQRLFATHQKNQNTFHKVQLEVFNIHLPVYFKSEIIIESHCDQKKFILRMPLS